MDGRQIREEKEYRRKAHTFIFDSCRALNAKALVIAAAMTICQRYFSQVSFRKIDRNVSVRRLACLGHRVSSRDPILAERLRLDLDRVPGAARTID